MIYFSVKLLTNNFKFYTLFSNFIMMIKYFFFLLKLREGTIFILIWGGAAIVTMNGKILGGKVSFLQSVCVLGYCIFPINLAAIAITLLKSILDIFIVKIIIAGAAFCWSSYSSLGFMASLVSEDKKELANYPIFLFYMFLSFFCLFI